MLNSQRMETLASIWWVISNELLRCRYVLWGCLHCPSCKPQQPWCDAGWLMGQYWIVLRRHWRCRGGKLQNETKRIMSDIATCVCMPRQCAHVLSLACCCDFCTPELIDSLCAQNLRYPRQTSRYSGPFLILSLFLILHPVTN